MEISAVIIDDEQNNIDNLEILLHQHCPQIIIVASAINANDGAIIIHHHNPDIVFLDIQMPDKNGFELLHSLQQHNFELIFVTAFDQYGIQAIKFSALDYLLKPVNIEELKSAVNKAIYRSAEKKQNQKLENLLQVLASKQQKEQHRIALSSAKETRFIKTEEIVRCESSNNYTTFFLEDGEKIMTSRPIFEYEEMLTAYGFIRCHQTHLVNKRFVKSLVTNDGAFLLLKDNTSIPVSRLKKDAIRKELSTC